MTTFLFAAVIPENAVLMALAWAALAMFWCCRLAGGIFGRRTARFTCICCMTVVVVIVIAALIICRGRSEDETRSLILAQRDSIEKSAATHGVDPGLVASIAYITQRDETTPFRSQLEELCMDAWLVDSHSHFGLSRALDISIGFCQIKPVTALTAWAIDSSSNTLDSPVFSRYYP